MAIRKQGHAMSQEAGSQGKRQFGKGVKPLELTGYVDFLKELRKVGMSKLGFQSNGPPHDAGESKARGVQGWNFPKEEARSIPNCGLTDTSLLSLVLPVSKWFTAAPVVRCDHRHRSCSVGVPGSVPTCSPEKLQHRAKFVH